MLLALEALLLGALGAPVASLPALRSEKKEKEKEKEREREKEREEYE